MVYLSFYQSSRKFHIAQNGPELFDAFEVEDFIEDSFDPDFEFFRLASIQPPLEYFLTFIKSAFEILIFQQNIL